MLFQDQMLGALTRLLFNSIVYKKSIQALDVQTLLYIIYIFYYSPLQIVLTYDFLNGKF